MSITARDGATLLVRLSEGAGLSRNGHLIVTAVADVGLVVTAELDADFRRRNRRFPQAEKVKAMTSSRNPSLRSSIYS